MSTQATNPAKSRLANFLVSIGVGTILLSIGSLFVARWLEKQKAVKCQDNLRSIALCMLARTSSDIRQTYCSGSFHPIDGSIEQFGWVSDVKKGLPNASLFCPSGCETSAGLASYVGVNQWPDLGPFERRGIGLFASSTCDDWNEVKNRLRKNRLDTNYASSWHLTRSQAVDHSGMSAGDLLPWYSGKPGQFGNSSSADCLQHCRGPLRLGYLDASEWPASSISLIGCAAPVQNWRGRSNSIAKSPFVLKTNQIELEPTRIARSISEGPSRVDSVGDVVRFSTRKPLNTIEEISKLSIGDTGDKLSHQDTRAFYAYHDSQLNMAMADGSIQQFTDINGDKLINPGFDVNQRRASAPLNLQPGSRLTWLDSQVEVNGWDWYTGSGIYRPKIVSYGEN